MKTGKKTIRSLSISDFRAGYLAQFREKRTLYAKKRSSVFLNAAFFAVLSFFVGFMSGKAFAPVTTTSALSSNEVEISVSSSDAKSSDTEIGIAPIVSTSAKNTKSLLEKAAAPVMENQASFKTEVATIPSYSLEIPSIGLFTNTVPTYVNENNDIVVPASGAGVLTAYKNRHFNLLVGHRANIFKNLDNLKLGDTINYLGQSYTVANIYQEVESSIDMFSLTSSSADLRLITCAGANNSERLVVIATPLA